MLAGLGLAGWKWYGQIQEYKTKQNEADKRISQLEHELKQLNKEDDSVSKDSTQVSQIEKDAEEIDKALTAACNSENNTQRPQKYIAGGIGQSVEKITPDFLNTYVYNNHKVYLPEKGWFVVGVGCRSVNPVEDEGGGHVSILQRQAAGNWRQVIAT